MRWRIDHHLIAVESAVIVILGGISATPPGVAIASGIPSAAVGADEAVLIAEPVAAILDGGIRRPVQAAVSVGLFAEIVERVLGGRSILPGLALSATCGG